MDTTDFSVNGIPRSSNADEDTPLLYVLRNDLSLKGTRFGCGEGHCGACKVIVDDHIARSCEIPVSAVQGKSVRIMHGNVDTACLE